MKNTNQTIQLQSIGHVPAKPAGELKVGDITIWNFGMTEKIERVIKQTEKTIVVEIQKGLQRRLNKNRLVGVQL